jgi:hypothetical protein
LDARRHVWLPDCLVVWKKKEVILQILISNQDTAFYFCRSRRTSGQPFVSDSALKIIPDLSGKCYLLRPARTAWNVPMVA